ncbi:MAG: ribonuclease J [Eubacteriales bacterium]|nr:ribonuclease J [Eubacteriales bacterium]
MTEELNIKSGAEAAGGSGNGKKTANGEHAQGRKRVYMTRRKKMEGAAPAGKTAESKAAAGKAAAGKKPAGKTDAGKTAEGKQTASQAKTEQGKSLQKPVSRRRPAAAAAQKEKAPAEKSVTEKTTKENTKEKTGKGQPVKADTENAKPQGRRTTQRSASRSQRKSGPHMEIRSTYHPDGHLKLLTMKPDEPAAVRNKVPLSVQVDQLLAQQRAEKEQQEKALLAQQNGQEKEKPAVKLSRRKKGHGPKHIKIIPLGGLEQIGMNITAFESDNSIIVVDCGMAFPEDDMLGIDLIIPDVSYLKQHIDKVKGFFITHGHEDHIGALPYILRDMNLPVYATRLTTALISNKLREADILDSAKLNIVSYGDVIDAGDFKVEFIRTNHSIQDAAALAIHSPAGVILHTGDFKVDYTPVFGDAIDLQRFAELGKAGVLALMADSTNALRPGFTMSERTVGRTFDSIFAEHTKNRLIVATFASNVDRVQQIINDAERFDRKVVVEGRSMVNVIGTAVELGYIKMKEGTLIDINQIRDYPDEKVVLVTTGSQGESMAALSRMASGQHRKVTIGPNDVIVMSSNPIPGNEKAVSKVINELTQKHAKVIYQDTHVSGHACQEELKLIYALVRPKFAIPVHGEYRHRVGQKEIAMALGVPKDNALIAETGDVIDLSEECCKIVDKVQAGPLMVDGLGVGDVGNIVMHDRQNLAQNGIIVVVLSLERYSGRLVSGPDIVSRGFVYVRENEDLMEEARLVVMDAVDDCLVHHVSDWGKIKNVIRDTLSDFLWRRLKRNPVILPIISEV